MSDIILLDEARAKREEEEKPVPHLQGPAVCLACKHEWQAVCPVEGFDPSKMDCPSCGCERGTFATHIEVHGPHWQCACGNHLFAITTQGVYCPCCSVWQFGANLKPAS